MFSLYLTWAYLHWTKTSGPIPPPPKGLSREFIKTPGGDIEILSAVPETRNPYSPPPVVFAHGGMGCAWVWAPYMRYLASRGIASYAVSARGHGNSWHPGFLRMVYGTTRRDLGDDLLAGIRHVEKKERAQQVVLVGHSSGGGLCQFLLSKGDIQVKGLALLGAVPGTGSYAVYANWARLDPWFSIRMLIHGWHPNSPLSHPALVRRAFFSDSYPDAELETFTRHLNRYESFLWPISMMVPFADGRKVLRSISGWGSSSNGSSSSSVGDRILIMAGTADRLMTRAVQEKSAQSYRTAFSELVRAGEIEAKDHSITPVGDDGDGDQNGDALLENTGHGVRLAYVPGAGHHLQNDSMWEIGAEKLFRFLQQL